jgi:hypothetical protein
MNIRFIKDYPIEDNILGNIVYAIIPKDTVLEFNKADNNYSYYNTTSKNVEGGTISSAVTMTLNEKDIDDIVKAGYAVKSITQEEYEDCLCKKAIDSNDEEIDKLKAELDTKDEMVKHYNKVVENTNQRYNDLTKRKIELLDAYNHRKDELENLMKKTDSELDAFEYANRAYICRAIIDAINYVIDGKSNKKA